MLETAQLNLLCMSLSYVELAESRLINFTNYNELYVELINTLSLIDRLQVISMLLCYYVSMFFVPSTGIVKSVSWKNCFES